MLLLGPKAEMNHYIPNKHYFRKYGAYMDKVTRMNALEENRALVKKMQNVVFDIL